MRIADLLAARRANKRMVKLVKKMKRDPHNRDLKAELWLRAREFHGHLHAGYGWNMPMDVSHRAVQAIALMHAVEDELGHAEIVDRVAHLVDPMVLRGLRREL